MSAKRIRLIIIWAFCSFILTVFIFPLTGISDNEITLKSILGGIVIWTAGGFALFYYEKRRFKKLNSHNQKPK